MQTETTAIFSDRLEDLIRESGKDMRTLAKKIGISTGALSNYRNDYAEVGITAFKKIADYFEVSYDYLLGNSDNRQRENIDIGKKLGLSDRAIEILESIKNMYFQKSMFGMEMILLIESLGIPDSYQCSGKTRVSANVFFGMLYNEEKTLKNVDNDLDRKEVSKYYGDAIDFARFRAEKEFSVIIADVIDQLIDKHIDNSVGKQYGEDNNGDDSEAR